MNNSNIGSNSYDAKSNSSNSTVLDKTILLELVKQATIALSTIQQVVSIVYNTEINNKLNGNILNQIINNDSSVTSTNNSSVITQTKINEEGNSVGSGSVTTVPENKFNNPSSSSEYKTNPNCNETCQPNDTCIIATDSKTNNKKLKKNNGTKSEFTRPLVNTCIVGHDVRGSIKNISYDVTEARENEEEVGISKIPNEDQDINNNYVNNCYSNKSTTINNRERIITSINKTNKNNIIKHNNHRMGNNNYENNYCINKSTQQVLSHNVNNNNVEAELNYQNNKLIINKQNKLDENKNRQVNIIKNKNKNRESLNNTNNNNNTNKIIIKQKNKKDESNSIITGIVGKKRKREDEYNYRISKQVYLYCKYCDNYGHTRSKCEVGIKEEIDQLEKEYNEKKNMNYIIKRRNSDSCIKYDYMADEAIEIKEEETNSNQNNKVNIINKTIVSQSGLNNNTTSSSTTTTTTATTTIASKENIIIKPNNPEEVNIANEGELDEVNDEAIIIENIEKKRKEEEEMIRLLAKDMNDENKNKNINKKEEEDNTSIAEEENNNTSGLNNKSSTTTVNNINKPTSILSESNKSNTEDVKEENIITKENEVEQPKEEEDNYPEINLSSLQADMLTKSIETNFPTYREDKFLFRIYLELKVMARDSEDNECNSYTIDKDFTERLFILFKKEGFSC